MKPLFEIKPIDREFYEKRLRKWLPDKIIDIHTHVWLKRFQEKKKRGISLRTVSWPSMVADENPVEHLVETYKLIFPGKTVTPLIFANLTAPEQFDAANDYVRQVSRRHGFPALIFSDPQWTASNLENRIQKGGFLGVKSYLTMSPSYLPESEIRIFDFFPHHQLEMLNRRGWVMMLHIPRDGRLRDPINLAQMLEIEERYPDIRLIIAHVGRAYCPEDIGDAFQVLAKTKKMYFDISANTNEEAFRQLLKTVGPKRVLFGSDLPILRMRTRRIFEHGKYINLVPKGIYGAVSADSHLREVEGEEAEKLTFFIYEELDAFRRASEAAGLTRGDINRVFYRNAFDLLKGDQNHEKKSGKN
ncbi:MAG: amidohydrolase family protein [Candidatus Omnitrophica bacterium]|nr:amidohydrolase family protein [Candidatus Omnitrophota bacterium]